MKRTYKKPFLQSPIHKIEIISHSLIDFRRLINVKFNDLIRILQIQRNLNNRKFYSNEQRQCNNVNQKLKEPVQVFQNKEIFNSKLKSIYIIEDSFANVLIPLLCRSMKIQCFKLLLDKNNFNNSNIKWNFFVEFV